MAVFKKDKPESKLTREAPHEVDFEALAGIDYKTLKAVAQTYADPALLYRPISLVRPLFRMEEGQLFQNTERLTLGEENGVCGSLPEGMASFIDSALPVDKEEIGRSFSPVSLPVGSLVFSEDDPAAFFYFVTRGHLAVFIKEPGGAEPIELETLGSGEFFGEEGLLGHKHRPYTVRVVEDALLMRAEVETLRQLVNRSARLMEILSSVRERRVACAISRVLGRNS
ncbi:cyclic nucleotide-binding domain-containing protein [bacterium]|nr:MAG: cyclic nucleotide-binding domain-containing protein [bacterium]